MIDIRLRYQASIFTKTTDIVPSPETIKGLIDLFHDKEFIPYLAQQEFRFIGGVPQKIRIKLVNPSSEWSVSFSDDRVDVDQNPIDPKGANLGDIATFAESASELFGRIIKKFDKRASRIAINSNALFQEMTEENLNLAFKTLFNPPPFYQTNTPFEWDWRAASGIQVNIGDTPETLNVLTSLKRIKGELTLPEQSIPFDRLSISLDLNTSALKADSRFEASHIVSFFKVVPTKHQMILKEIEDYLNA